MKNKKGYVHVGGISTIVLQNNLENERNVNINGNQNSNNSNKGYSAFKGKGIAVGGGDNSSAKNESNRGENSGYTNVTVGSTDEINSSDSRIDLNRSSDPKV